MILKKIHLDFWQAKKAMPAWSIKIKKPAGRFVQPLTPSINAVVNAHADIRLQKNEMDWHNTINLLQMARRNSTRSTGIESYVFYIQEYLKKNWKFDQGIHDQRIAKIRRIAKRMGW